MVKYFCDKCKKEVEKSFGLQRIVVTIGSDFGCEHKHSMSLNVCNECVEELGFKKPEKGNINANFKEEHRIENELYSLIKKCVSEVIEENQ